MTFFHRTIAVSLGLALSCSAAGALAQSATVTLSSQKQYIRGFGGMNHAAWAGDLTAAERTLAFGNADKQLGLSALRIPVTDGSPDSVNVATAKAAIASGAIVFATPWNAAGTMSSSQFASYATHLTNFVSYMKNQGVNLYAIGVQNEPDYGAEAGWGSWSAALCHDFLLNYGGSVGTKLMSCESFSYNKSYYDPILNDSAALAKATIFGTHLYGTAVNAYAYPLFDSKGTGKERWMTEHYTDSTTDANSWPNALGVASELHNSMVTGQFNLYTWWYIKRSYGFINNGAITKRGWCMAHWSKFVRPGFYRVDATAAPTAGVSVSAFKSDTDVVIVIVNTNSSAKSLALTVDGSKISSYAKYTTSSTKSLADDGMVTASNGALSVSLDASSVTTLRGTGSATGGGGGSGGTGGVGGAGGSSSVGGSSSTGGANAAAGSTSVAGSNGLGGQDNVGGAPTGLGGQDTSSGGVGASGAGAGPTSSAGALATAGASAGGLQGIGNEPSSDSPADTQSGCSCRSAGRAPTDWTSFAPLLLGLVGLVSRRRRSRQER
ncbi:MAG: MYXO-CTERM sorting domain-containing protein [Myxococcales bacterium]